MKKRITSILIVLAIVAGAGFLLNKSHQKINQGKKNLISSDIIVNVEPVGETSTSTSMKLTGTMTPYTDLVVSAQAAGQITSLAAELGQTKQKGSVIATIDNQLKKYAVETAELNVEKQNRDLKRFEELFKGGAITQQQLDDARMGYTNAQIQWKQAKKQLADATITAPFSGIVTEKNVEVGSYTNIGTPIVRLIDISRLRIKLNVSENNVYKLKVGHKALVQCDVLPGQSFEGKITFISSKGDDAHNFQVEVVLQNNGKLKAGTFANVSIDIPGSGNSIAVPRSALLGSSNDAKVYVYENGKVKSRKIAVSGGNDQWLFVSDGLNKGDEVVTAGQINLIDGMEVKKVNNK